MRVFFDTEFTGLQQNTTLISIGCVAEDGSTFYAEFTDYDRKQINDWIQENVLAHLSLNDGIDTTDPCHIRVRERSAVIAFCLRDWLEHLDNGPKVEMWSDVLAYDWVLFCELFGGASHIPECICYIPFDLATLFLLKGIDPDVDREKFAGIVIVNGLKHNALWDAYMIKACYKKLVAGSEEVDTGR